MSTHHELLKAIVANYKEDTPRLAYADWLDEFGDCDRHAATAEFIRLSCPPRANPRPRDMPPKAYAWLRRNWKRLVPTVAALQLRVSEDSRWSTPENWQGRYLGLRFSYSPISEFHEDSEYWPTFPALLEFWKGFCVGVTAEPWPESPKMGDRIQLFPALIRDQPLFPARPPSFFSMRRVKHPDFVRDPDQPPDRPEETQGAPT